MDTWKMAHEFLFDMKVGDKYYTSTDEYVACVKRTLKRIQLSNGKTISIKKINGYDYLTSKGIKRGNKLYDGVSQILRDVEGYLIYCNHKRG